MMRRVLHDVVHRASKAVFEGQMHRRGDKRLGGEPSGLVVIPFDALMRVVHINHHANHAIPEHKRHNKSGDNRRPDADIRRQSTQHHHRQPNNRVHADQHIVPKKGRTAGRLHFFARPEHLVPPDFDHVVQRRPPTTAVNTFHKTTPRAHLLIFRHRRRHPNKIHAFEVGIAVVHHIVPHVPQAVWT